jgi:hypothetical protein
MYACPPPPRAKAVAGTSKMVKREVKRKDDIMYETKLKIFFMTPPPLKYYLRQIQLEKHKGLCRKGYFPRGPYSGIFRKTSLIGDSPVRG